MIPWGGAVHAMRRRIAFPLLALLVSVLAGCAAGPSQSSAGTPPGTTPTSATPASNATNDSAAFLLVGPELRFPNGTASTAFHEDDAIVAHYVISLTPGAPHDATALAAYLVNGKVVDVQTVHLRPGESRPFDAAVSLANQTMLRVQVKVGAAEGDATASIVRWPRVNETFMLGNASVTLTWWAHDAQGVHADLSVWTPPEGSVTALDAALLCPGSEGKLASGGAQPVPMAPGQAAASSLDFPPCTWPYGLALSASDAGGTHLGRVLFGQ